MPNEWSLRNEILLATQRWPWLALVCFTGALLGWLVSLAWPTPYRATRELYVGLNVYRALNDLSVSEYAGIKLVNANDYKNWQMSSLNSLIIMDSVIDETLIRLQEQDPYWKGVNRDEFARSLHVYWRNAGKWRLVAEDQDPERAAAAVKVWQNVALEAVHNAVLESQEAMLLEFKLRALANNKTEIMLSAESMRSARSNLEDWKDQLARRSSKELVNPEEHWRIWKQIVNLQPGDDWRREIDVFPAEGTSSRAYLIWLDQAIPQLDLEIRHLDEQLHLLDDQETATADQFSQASQMSLGLSATLDVDKISDSRTQQAVTRPTGILMLVGSLLGLFVWLAVWISGISLRGRA